MNYTENYHLPQWVKEDRILMEDFNQMCKDIETGLSKTAQAAEKLGQNSEAGDKLLTRYLLRMAYNQYLAAQTIDPFPEQMGVFYQNADRDLSAEDGSSWDGARFRGSGTGFSLNETFFGEYVKIRSDLIMYKDNPANNTPLEAEICTPVATKVEKWNLKGSFNDCAPNTHVMLLLTINNLDTGEVEQSRTLDLTQGNTSGSLINNPQTLNLYFHGGTHYLLKIEPVGNPILAAHITFAAAYETRVQGIGNGQNKVFSVSYTMREQEGSSVGLLIMRCKAGGPTGQLTVQWDGKTVEPVSVRPCQNEQGLELREMIYLRWEPIPAETSFSVNFVCGEYGSIWFQDWGAVLL